MVKVVAARRPCPRCADSLKGAPAPGKSLADLFQREAKEFVTNLDRPDRIPSLLRPNAVDRCLWQCLECHHQWESTVTNRAAGKGCPACGRRRAVVSRRTLAAGASFRETHPELAALFVSNSTNPGRGPDGFTAGTNDMCVWRCPACQKTFERAVYTHATRGLCGPCGHAAVGVTRRRAPREKSLAIMLPKVAASFVENLSWPGHGPEALFQRSTAVCSWRCRCGATYEATVRQRTKSPEFGCGRCRRRGRSLLELEVAHLLATATGEQVEVDFPIDGGRAQAERIDLFLPVAGLYIDLDPAQWHSRPEQHAQDLRKSAIMAKLDVRYVRIRQAGTPPIPGETLVTGSKDSTEWFRVLAQWLSTQSRPCLPLSNAQIARCLQAARDEWKSLRDTPPDDSLASLFPDLAKELVENLSRPEMSSEWLPAGSGDRCHWRCISCQYEWRTLVVSRTRSKTGCPRCASQKRAYRTRLSGKAPRVRDVAPHLVAEVVEILDLDKSGDIEVGDLARGSSIRVLWKCQSCTHQWVATVADRTSGRGCRPCGIRRRSNAAPGQSLQDLFPDVARGFIANLDNPDRGPEQLGPGSQDRCRWRCPECGAETWEVTVQNRTSRQGCGGCRVRRVGRRRAI
ncbi:zinc-ribbon domain-containing protein [Dactylosporangium maewongense]|uniref:zinc-ribbon domain-containing protein n=1 Tax=Dactylosporangium maewongense TaxID=634393 RepID=UPI003CD0B425